MAYASVTVNGFAGAPTGSTVGTDFFLAQNSAASTVNNGYYEYSWTANAEL